MPRTLSGILSLTTSSGSLVPEELTSQGKERENCFGYFSFLPAAGM